jgi:hypothetical protein
MELSSTKSRRLSKFLTDMKKPTVTKSSVPLAPTASVSWPDQFPDNPHDCLAIRGWHSFGCRGYWDVDTMARDFSHTLQFSECRSATDARTPPRKRWKAFTFCPSEGVIVIARIRAPAVYFLCVWAPSHEAAEREFLLLRDRYKHKPKHLRKKSNFVVITSQHGFLQTRDVEMPCPLRREADLILHYGQEFNEWNSNFLARLRQKRTGVTIFRGEPGTGKTTYLRYLTHKLRRTHRFYYLPLCVYPLLAAPAAVTFWMEQHDGCKRFKKVVILEDAESLVMQRASDNQANLSNLLNISDGFLGEMLKMHVICTINCRLDRIDPAILRPGRLVAMREFVRLSLAQALLLARTKRLSIDPRANYSLAELYNSHCEAQSPKRTLGFATASI